MFCPKCGQRQASEDGSFCCACGTKLHSAEGSTIRRIIALVMHIALTALAIGGWGPWTMPNYMQIRALILLISVITFLLLFSNDLKRVFSKLFNQGEDQPGQETSSASSLRAVNQIRSAPHPSALPPVRSMPVNSIGQRSQNTAEMVRPPSITEHTTELLDDINR
jgi:hypothetical protein